MVRAAMWTCSRAQARRRAVGWQGRLRKLGTNEHLVRDGTMSPAAWRNYGDLAALRQWLSAHRFFHSAAAWLACNPARREQECCRHIFLATLSSRAPDRG